MSKTLRRIFLIAGGGLLVVLLLLFGRRCSSAAGTRSAGPTPSESSTGAAQTTPLPVSNLVSVTALPLGNDRMRLVDCAIDATGVRLIRASSAEGRVKAPSLSIAPWRIEFVVYGRGGEKLYAGSMDHPLHRRYEYADDKPAAGLHAVTGEESEGTLQVRVPAELPAVRIQFLERRPNLPPEAPAIPLGEISLP